LRTSGDPLPLTPLIRAGCERSAFCAGADLRFNGLNPGMTDDLHNAGRYSSLRDYLRVLRRYRLLIVLITLVGAAAGYADAKRQKPVYDATATVSFQDPTQDLSIVGLGSPQTQSPAQVAAVAAETITRPELMEAVKAQLKTSLPIGALAGSVGGSVSASSGLLGINSIASNPAFAAALANAVADQLVAQSNRNTQAQFAAVAADVRRQIAALSRSHSPGNGTQLVVYQDELAHLVTLSSFAKSAQIAEPAQPPGAASSPKTTRSTLIGLILGLLLAIAAAFVRDSIDRRLRNPNDVEETFGLPVIGHVRQQTMGRVAYMSNGSGEDERLDLESFRILRRNLELLDPEHAPTSVLVTSAVAEEGKTTVATSLALVMAAAGKTTLLVDCDLRRPDLAGRMGVEQSPGISEYLSGTASPQEILRTVTFAEPAISAPITQSSENGSASPIVHTLVCIPAGSVSSRTAELLSSSTFRRFMEQVTSTYDVVVFDSSPLLPVADTLEMLPHVGAVIVCAREARTTRDQGAAVKAVLARFPECPAGTVVTGIRPRRAEHEVYAYSHSYS
jgi:tyrosine-protein kinase